MDTAATIATFLLALATTWAPYLIPAALVLAWRQRVRVIAARRTQRAHSAHQAPSSHLHAHAAHQVPQEAHGGPYAA